MKIRRARKPRTPVENLYLPSLSDNVSYEDSGENESHKVPRGPDSKR